MIASSSNHPVEPTRSLHHLGIIRGSFPNYPQQPQDEPTFPGTSVNNLPSIVLSSPGLPEPQSEPHLPSPYSLLTFGGTPSEDIDAFLENVLTTSFMQGRERDDRWNAFLASTCLTGTAMRWFSLQKPDVQCSWTKLSRALVLAFPPPNSTASSSRQPSRSITTVGSRLSTPGITPPPSAPSSANSSPVLSARKLRHQSNASSLATVPPASPIPPVPALPPLPSFPPINFTSYISSFPPPPSFSRSASALTSSTSPPTYTAAANYIRATRSAPTLKASKSACSMKAAAMIPNLPYVPPSKQDPLFT
ncbi:hypothetical protein FRB96_005384 [Tulasnella sp. 330]|nr:hypothetical protein FRB96_005384 [Tulasnella sp. 330]